MNGFRILASIVAFLVKNVNEKKYLSSCIFAGLVPRDTRRDFLECGAKETNGSEMQREGN